MKKVIQVLGAGCAKCENLRRNAETAVRELGIDAVVEKITEVDAMLELGVLVTPALAVDGEVKAAGRLLTPDEIKAILA